MITWDAAMAALTAISTVCAVIFGYVAFFRTRKRDSEENGAKNAVLVSDIGYIKSSVDDLKRIQERQSEKYESIVVRLTAVEASSTQAHKRMDEHLKQLHAERTGYTSDT